MTEPVAITVSNATIFSRSVVVRMPGYALPPSGGFFCSGRRTRNPADTDILLRLATTDGSIRVIAIDAEKAAVTLALLAPAHDLVALVGPVAFDLVYVDADGPAAVGSFDVTFEQAVTRVALGARPDYTQLGAWGEIVDLAGQDWTTVWSLHERGLPGARGPSGPAPATRWVGGAVLEVQQPDGSWSASGDLRGQSVPPDVLARVGEVLDARDEAVAAAAEIVAQVDAAAANILTRPLTGLAPAAAAPLSGADRIIDAFGKLQAQVVGAEASAAAAAAKATMAQQAIVAVQTTSYVVATWAALTALAAPPNGTRGEVIGDAGTHVQVGGSEVVANSGVYSYSTSAGGWVRLGSNAAAVTAARSDIVAIGKDRYVYVGADQIEPVKVSAGGHVLVGYDIANGAPIGVRPYAPARAKRVVVIAYGQSPSCGMGGDVALTLTPPWPHIRTFGSGVKSAQAHPEYTYGATANTTPGLTTEMIAVEDNNTTCINQPAGETGLVASMTYLTELLARHLGVTPGVHTLFCATAGRGGLTISSLDLRTAFLVVEDQCKAVRTLADAAGEAVEIGSFRWLQGQADAEATTTTDAYAAALVAMAAKLATMAYYGTYQTRPALTFVVQACHKIIPSGGRIALAQTRAAGMSPLVKFVAPDWHIARVGDALHYTSKGYQHIGAYLARAEFEALWLGLDPKYLRLVSAVYDGRLRLKYAVPTPPLVIDVVTWAQATQNGVRVVDPNGDDVALSDFRIDADGVTLSAACARAPAAGAVARVAMDYLSPSLPLVTQGVASANLRDSTPDTFVFGGETFRLWHVAPAARADIAIMG